MESVYCTCTRAVSCLPCAQLASPVPTARSPPENRTYRCGDKSCPKALYKVFISIVSIVSHNFELCCHSRRSEITRKLSTKCIFALVPHDPSCTAVFVAVTKVVPKLHKKCTLNLASHASNSTVSEPCAYCAWLSPEAFFSCSDSSRQTALHAKYIRKAEAYAINLLLFDSAV